MCFPESGYRDRSIHQHKNQNIVVQEVVKTHYMRQNPLHTQNYLNKTKTVIQEALYLFYLSDFECVVGFNACSDF
jgi:hypothetical protein